MSAPKGSCPVSSAPVRVTWGTSIGAARSRRGIGEADVLVSKARMERNGVGTARRADEAAGRRLNL
ncbi:hypothetical protein GCM10010464_47200 [Pseudonocardia yunnanensis]